MATINPVLISRPPRGKLPLQLGQPHHALQLVAQRFAAMLEDHGMTTAIVDAPEQFKSPAFAEAHDLGEGEHLHLIFRGTQDIRTIPGAYNIAWFPWSFDALKSSGAADELILSDQVRMLRGCSEIWVPSAHTQAVLRRHGLTEVFVMPAPIPAPATLPADRHEALGGLDLIESVPLVTHTSGDEAGFARLADRFARRLGSHAQLKRALAGGQLFLTVCDPTDPRKNLAATIEGFLMATAGRDDVVLLVKLVNWGMMESPAAFLYHQIRGLFGDPHALHEESVLLFSGALSEDEMAQLYSSADFYLAAPLGEGQNLALLEAMAHGCVPVAVRNTAMADYIDDDDAIVIAEGRYAGLVSGLSRELAQMRLDTNFAGRHQIADAVTRALALDGAARAARQASARERIAKRYAADRVFVAFAARLDAVRPGLAPVVEPAPTPDPTRPNVPEGVPDKRWWR